MRCGFTVWSWKPGMNCVWEMRRVPPVIFLPPLGKLPDPPGISHTQFMPGFLDQTVKPHRITATFYSHNRRPRQLRVKPTHVVVLVIEFPLMQLPIARVHPAHHLRADMQVHSEVKCSHLCLLARARPANLAGPGWGEPTPLAPGGAFLMTSLTKTAGVCTNNSHCGTQYSPINRPSAIPYPLTPVFATLPKIRL